MCVIRNRLTVYGLVHAAQIISGILFMTALVCLASSETFVLSFQYPNLKYLIMPKFSHGLGNSHSLAPGSFPPPPPPPPPPTNSRQAGTLYFIDLNNTPTLYPVSVFYMYTN